MENLSTHLAGPVEKDSRVLQAELALRRNLRAGSWGQFMPGIRALASTFNVSPATMVKAVDRVRIDGWISNTTARQRFTIHRDVILQHKGKDAMLRTLLLLAPQTDRNETSNSTAQVLLILWDLLAPKGWNIRFHIDDYSGGKRRQKQWDDLLQLEKPQAVLAILGTPAMAAWARDTKIPTFFCGGSLGDFKVPVAGVSSYKMIDEAIDRLFSLGHKNISVMLANRSPEYCKRIQTLVAEKFNAAGLVFSEKIHAPTTKEDNVNVFRDGLSEVFAAQPVTAFICLDWREYVATMCYIQEKGLKVPEDISIICLSHDHSSNWSSPIPSHYHHPMEEIVKTLADWIEDITTYTNFELNANLSGIWQEGETLSTARQK